MPFLSPRRAAVAFTTAALILPVTAANGDQILDDFGAGLAAPHWKVLSNQPLFELDDTAGDVLVSKPEGGSGGLDTMAVELVRPIRGDFDLSIDFSAASIDRVTGTPGNQIQLDLWLGGQFFAVVRSDEITSGHNAHVFVDPPVQWEGPILTSATAGTLRITRVGGLVSGFYDATLLFQADYGAATVTGVRFLLQNNGTTDPVSVRFDDFALTADEIGIFADGFEHGDVLLWSSSSP